MARPAKKAAGEEAQSGELKPLVLVWGTDEYRVAAQARELVPKLCPPAEQALGLEVLDAAVVTVDEAVAVLNTCIEAIATVGFFGSARTVWLRGATFFSEAEPGRFVDVKQAVARLVEEIKRGLAPGVKLLISADKVDRRSAFYKTMQASATVIEFSVPDKPHEAEAQARQTLAEIVGRHGLTAPGDALDLIVGKVGSDTRQLVQEVSKLLCFLGDRRQFTVADVEAVVSSSREAQGWDLADVVGRRDLPGSLRVFRQLLFQRESAVGLMVGLEARLRDLILFRVCMDRRWARLTGERHWRKVDWVSTPEVEGALGALPADPRKMNPYRAGRLADQASRFSAQELAEAHRLAMETHERMTGGEGLPAELVMEFFLIRILGGARRAAS